MGDVGKSSQIGCKIFTKLVQYQQEEEEKRISKTGRKQKKN